MHCTGSNREARKPRGKNLMTAWCLVHYKAKDLQKVSPGSAFFQLESRKVGGETRNFLKGSQNASLAKIRVEIS